MTFSSSLFRKTVTRAVSPTFSFSTKATSSASVETGLSLNLTMMSPGVIPERPRRVGSKPAFSALVCSLLLEEARKP